MVQWEAIHCGWDIMEKGEKVKERGINSNERRKKAAVLGILQLGFEG